MAASHLILAAVLFTSQVAAVHAECDEGEACPVDAELMQISSGGMDVSSAFNALVSKPVSPRRLAAETCGEKIVEDSTPWEHARRKSGIVNGQAASKCEWKWQACLIHRASAGGRCLCGGTLIAEKWVLTAAHCLRSGEVNVAANQISATLGEYRHENLTDDKTEMIHHIKRIIRHEDYNHNTYENDIALLELEEPAVYGDCIGAACLPTEEVPEETRCFVTGWGNLVADGDQPQVLQEAAVDITKKSYCEHFYRQTANIASGMVCAQGEKLVEGGNKAVIDACQGDSGGPLVCERGGKWTLHGVVSFGVGCADPLYPGVYARVSSYVEWINTNTATTPEPSTPSVRAVGDPHLSNIHNQHFDLMKPGRHALLRVPKAARDADALMVVMADAQALGGACADMYFQSLDISGKWAGEQGVRYSVQSPSAGNTTGWVGFGKVDLKVTWGRTLEGMSYLNVFARKLSAVGLAVGGLLGDDDHTFASTPTAGCERVIALLSSSEEQQVSEASTASAFL